MRENLKYTWKKEYKKQLLHVTVLLIFLLSTCNLALAAGETITVYVKDQDGNPMGEEVKIQLIDVNGNTTKVTKELNSESVQILNTHPGLYFVVGAFDKVFPDEVGVCGVDGDTGYGTYSGWIYVPACDKACPNVGDDWVDWYDGLGPYKCVEKTCEGGQINGEEVCTITKRYEYNLGRGEYTYVSEGENDVVQLMFPSDKKTLGEITRIYIDSSQHPYNLTQKYIDGLKDTDNYLPGREYKWVTEVSADTAKDAVTDYLVKNKITDNVFLELVKLNPTAANVWLTPKTLNVAVKSGIPVSYLFAAKEYGIVSEEAIVIPLLNYGVKKTAEKLLVGLPTSIVSGTSIGVGVIAVEAYLFDKESKQWGAACEYELSDDYKVLVGKEEYCEPTRYCSGGSGEANTVLLNCSQIPVKIFNYGENIYNLRIDRSLQDEWGLYGGSRYCNTIDSGYPEDELARNDVYLRDTRYDYLPPGDFRRDARLFYDIRPLPWKTCTSGLVWNGEPKTISELPVHQRDGKPIIYNVNVVHRDSGSSISSVVHPNMPLQSRANVVDDTGVVNVFSTGDISGTFDLNQGDANTYGFWFSNFNAPATTGNYSFGVHAVDLDGNEVVYDNDGYQYLLKLVGDVGSGGDAGDSVSGAVDVSGSEGGLLSGFLIPGGGDAVDWFRFDVGKGQSYKISINSTGDFVLRVLQEGAYGMDKRWSSCNDSVVFTGVSQHSTPVYFSIVSRGREVLPYNLSFTVSGTPDSVADVSTEGGSSFSEVNSLDTALITYSEQHLDYGEGYGEIIDFAGVSSPLLYGTAEVTYEEPGVMMATSDDGAGVAGVYDCSPDTGPWFKADRVEVYTEPQGEHWFACAAPVGQHFDSTKCCRDVYLESSDCTPSGYGTWYCDDVFYVPASQMVEDDYFITLYIRDDYGQKYFIHNLTVDYNKQYAPDIQEFKTSTLGYNEVEFTAEVDDQDNDLYEMLVTVDGDEVCSDQTLSNGIFQCTYDTSALNHGDIYTAEARVWDHATNYADTHQIDFRVKNDGDNPTVDSISVSGTEDGNVSLMNVSGTVELLVNVEDSGSGIETIDWAVGGQTIGSGQSLEWTPSSEGYVMLTVDVEDNVGNSRSYSEQVYVDNTAPSVNVVSPADGLDFTGLTELEIDASDDSGVGGVEWILHDGNQQSLLATGRNSVWDSRGLDGQYLLTARVWDKLGNLREETVSVTVHSPNLVVNGSEVDVPEDSIAGVQDQITAVVRNTGSLDAYNVNVSFYANYTHLGSRVVNLSAGGLDVVSVEWLPENAGDVVVAVVADPVNDVLEPSEADNYVVSVEKVLPSSAEIVGEFSDNQSETELYFDTAGSQTVYFTVPANKSAYHCEVGLETVEAAGGTSGAGVMSGMDVVTCPLDTAIECNEDYNECEQVLTDQDEMYIEYYDGGSLEAYWGYMRFDEDGCSQQVDFDSDQTQSVKLRFEHSDILDQARLYLWTDTQSDNRESCISSSGWDNGNCEDYVADYGNANDNSVRIIDDLGSVCGSGSCTIDITEDVKSHAGFDDPTKFVLLFYPRDGSDGTYIDYVPEPYLEVTVTACDCASGSCCDGCDYLDNTHRCWVSDTPQYGCPDGTELGDDVKERYEERYCTGASAECPTTTTYSPWTLHDDCESNEVCTWGDPTCNPVDCAVDGDCGVNGYVGTPYCVGDDVYQDHLSYECINAGTVDAICSDETVQQMIEDCPQGCLDGVCRTDSVDTPTLSIEASEIWSHSGWFTGSETIQGLEAEVNQYIDSACTGDADCNIPLTVSIDSPGTLKLTGLKVVAVNPADMPSTSTTSTTTTTTTTTTLPSDVLCSERTTCGECILEPYALGEECKWVALSNRCESIPDVYVYCDYGCSIDGKPLVMVEDVCPDATGYSQVSWVSYQPIFWGCEFDPMTGEEGCRPENLTKAPEQFSAHLLGKVVETNPLGCGCFGTGCAAGPPVYAIIPSNEIQPMLDDGYTLAVTQSGTPYRGGVASVADEPVADAGGPYMVDDNGVRVSGVLSYDQDGGEITSYQWDVDSDGTTDYEGDTLTFTLQELQNIGLADETANPMQLTVEDASGNTNSSTAEVRVKDYGWPDPTTTTTSTVTTSTTLPDADADGFVAGVDCDDTNPLIYPGAVEVCNGVDDDCDGGVDEDLSFDADSDGYTSLDSCGGMRDDCDDNDAGVNPGTEEICDGVDNDCDGQLDEGDVCGTPYLDFSNLTIISYSGSQDADPSQYEVLDGGATLHLWGNNWKAITLPTDVMDGTTISFQFMSSGSEGEVNGVGLDEDLTLSPDRVFQVYGTQPWGIRDYAGYAGGWQQYEIPVGQFYQGSMQCLVFANDADASQATDVYLTNVTVVTTCSSGYRCRDEHHLGFMDEECTWSDLTYCEIGCGSGQCIELPPTQQDSLILQNPVSYESGQDRDSMDYEFLNDDTVVHMWGNNWKAFSLPIDVNRDTVLSFYFLSVGEEGEVNGVGFDNDLLISGDKHFQVYGTQAWGISDYSNYSGNGWAYYEIPVGQYFTGHMDYLTLSNDADAGQDTSVYYANIKVATTCTPGYRCRDEHYLGFMDEECTWSDLTYCDIGCGDGQCVQLPPAQENDVLLENPVSYATTQDVGSGNYGVLGNGTILHMWGNNWKAVPFNTEVNADTVLSFRFMSAGEEGEVHGVGFDDDLTLSPDKHFQVYGTQAWGISDYSNYSGNGWAYYEIPVGQYFTGHMDYLTLSNDADAGQDTDIYYANVNVATTCTPGYRCRDENYLGFMDEECMWSDLTYCDIGCGDGQCIELPPMQQGSLVLQNPLSYGGSQDQDNMNYELLNGGTVMHLWGNNWKAFNLPVDVDSGTTLSFYFLSAGEEAEVNGVGFDNNLGLSSNTHFKVYGTQAWGIRTYDNYPGSGWTYYEIPVGQHYTGHMNYLTLSNDADANQNTNVYYANIRVT